MVVEKELEAKIIAALSAALTSVSGVKFEGTWQASNAGGVKGEVDGDVAARIAVAVGAPEYDQYLSAVASLPVAIAITVRQESAPTASALETIYGPIEDVLVGWHLDMTGDSLEDLTSVHFRADGVRLDAGEPPRFDQVNATWSIARALTVRGVLTLITEQ